MEVGKGGIIAESKYFDRKTPPTPSTSSKVCKLFSF